MLNGSLHPVQPTILMLSKSPCIAQSTLVGCPPSEYNEHTVSASSFGSADCSRVVNSGTGDLGTSVDGGPVSVGWSVDLEHPDVVNGFTASISSEDN